MQLLEERIARDGRVFPGNVLKIDNFLNHQIDVDLLNEMGKEFYRLFGDSGVNKIMTIEASGIAIASVAALHFHVPVLFVKKSQSSNISPDVYHAKVKSYTHGKVYDVVCSKEYLNPSDRVLLIDDFLAKGEALNGMIELVNQAGAALVGAGIAVEKHFQGGGDLIRAEGIRVESLAMIESLEGGKVTFCR